MVRIRPQGTPHGPDAGGVDRVAPRSPLDAKAIDPAGPMAAPPVVEDDHCDGAEGGMSLSPADPGMASTDGGEGAAAGAGSPSGPGSVAWRTTPSGARV